MNELPDSDVPKHIAGVKDYIFKSFSNLFIKFVSQMNFNYSNKTVKGDSETLEIFFYLQTGDVYRYLISTKLS